MYCAVVPVFRYSKDNFYCAFLRVGDLDECKSAARRFNDEHRKPHKVGREAAVFKFPDIHVWNHYPPADYEGTEVLLDFGPFDGYHRFKLLDHSRGIVFELDELTPSVE